MSRPPSFIAGPRTGGCLGTIIIAAALSALVLSTSCHRECKPWKGRVVRQLVEQGKYRATYWNVVEMDDGHLETFQVSRSIYVSDGVGKEVGCDCKEEPETKAQQ